jgi:3',5'-cyclic AMP phosphodiesterase CpdA
MRTNDFTFLVVTDTHVDVNPGATDWDWDSTHNLLLNTRGAEALDVFVRDANDLRPDFVVHCGDITNRSDERSFRASFATLSRLTCPWYIVPGNHDTYWPAARQFMANLLGRREPRLFEAVRLGGWRLLLLDACYWRYADGSVREAYDRWHPDPLGPLIDTSDPNNPVVDIEIPDFELAWLRDELARDPLTPTLCFTHPVLKVRRGHPSKTPPAAADAPGAAAVYDTFSPALNRLLEDAACVKAVFCGHGHWHECASGGATGTTGALLYCQTGGLVEYPCEFRKVSVSGTGMETVTLGLSSGGLAERSYLPARGNRWPAGEPSDRRRSWTFRGGRP